MIGKKIENFKVTEILGEGGMGIVYKAFDLKLERYIALKILNSQALNNPRFIARFKAEARNQAKLTHPNIVPIYGFTEGGGTLGIAMEYVNGETLEHMIQRLGRLDLYDALYVLQQILKGAGYAHAMGFVHRDIKPSNIIINQEGTVKIMDFGISKSLHEQQNLTRTGTKIGTLLYMSPEQIKALVPTNQSDIYSIGITFYEMLVGLTPFNHGTDFEIMEAHLKKTPPKISSIIPGIPSEVNEIISKSLAKSLAKRYHSCEELLADVDSLFLKLTSKAEKEKIRKKTKGNDSVNSNLHNKLKFYFVTFVVICLLGVLSYFVFNVVSHYWNNGSSYFFKNNSKENSYQSNPSYHLKSNWEQLPAPLPNNLNSVAFINNKIGFICGNQGAVIKTEDGGSHWNVLIDSVSINLYKVNFDNPRKGFLLGSNGTVLITPDTGRSWEKLDVGVRQALFGISFLKDHHTGFIVGNNGIILKTVDDGNTWHKISSPSINLLYNILFINNFVGFITGWDGTILRTTDGGNSWNQLKQPTHQYLRGISFSDEKEGIIVGGNGTILRTNDAGLSWDVIPEKSVSGFYSVKMINKNDGIILTSKGNILISDDRGKSWLSTSSGNYTELTGIAVTSSNKIFIVGYNGIILTNRSKIN